MHCEIKIDKRQFVEEEIRINPGASVRMRIMPTVNVPALPSLSFLTVLRSSTHRSDDDLSPFLQPEGRFYVLTTEFTLCFKQYADGCLLFAIFPASGGKTSSSGSAAVLGCPSLVQGTEFTLLGGSTVLHATCTVYIALSARP